MKNYFKLHNADWDFNKPVKVNVAQLFLKEEIINQMYE